jgi:YgiT-type zinc finger domain-containing protein
MKCLICRQAETVDSFTSLTLERDEIRLVVNGVPARVCAGCGEAYVAEDVAVELLQKAGKMVEMGEQGEIWNYV